MLISSVVLYLRKGRFTATIVGDTRGKTIRLKEMDNLCGCCEWDIQTALNTSGGRVFQFIIVKWPLLRILGITWMAQGRTAQRNNRKGVCWIRWSVLSVIIDSCFKNFTMIVWHFHVEVITASTLRLESSFLHNLDRWDRDVFPTFPLAIETSACRWRIVVRAESTPLPFDRRECLFPQ